MPTLLHISDLHRTKGPRLYNEELLPAILNDSRRWADDGIPQPDLLVVSGDLIQGVSMDESEADREIETQYEEAGEFLNELTSKLFGSDLARVVIVPGNHDVQWNRAKQAMRPLESPPPEIAESTLDPESGVRWNWREMQAYEIYDGDRYGSRFEHFRRFQASFYAGLEPNPIVEGTSDLVFVEYPTLDLAVAGFASWHGNDCFCHVGAIHASSLARARDLLDESRSRFGVAVWHHGIVGGPRAQDYMDQRVIHRLIDSGFTIGLHGHQHFPGAAPFDLRLPNLTSMAVIGAGSLAVGDLELPMGERRQYNIVVIDEENHVVRTHIRSMSSAGVFTKSHRDDFGGRDFMELPLHESPVRTRGTAELRKLDDAMAAVQREEYPEALSILTPGVISSFPTEARQITVLALEGSGQTDALISYLDPPQSAEELFRAVSVLLDKKDFDVALERLERGRSLVSHSQYVELTQMIEARRQIS